MPSPPMLVAAVTAAGALVASLTAAPVLMASQQDPSSTQAPPTVSAKLEIPPTLLPPYQRAPACQGLPWQIVAGIGSVESNHGRHAGARLDPATGDVSPAIIGIPLDGSRSAAIRVPAGGSPWHPDPTWDHAVGPMQFLTATWTRWGTDASGDGKASPHNAFDAIASTGRYLCSGQPRLDSIPAAVRRYNNSDRYVTDVLAKAHAYGMSLTEGRRSSTGRVPSAAAGAGGPVLRGDAATVIRFARAQLGKPYIWGGEGPAGYDCSGLTMRAYEQVGIRLPHKSALQVNYGRPVDWHREPIRAGDLLFLRGSVPVHDYGHVGIALDSTRWINAPQTGDVIKIAPIPYSLLQAARRVLVVDTT